MKLRNIALMIAGVSMAYGASAVAEQGTLTSLQSPVMVNQGAEYVEATEGMKLNEGDQLMVLQGGSAAVNFASGCSMVLGGNELLRVTQDVCNTPASAGINAQVAPTSSGTSGSSSASSGMSTVGLVATGAVAAYAIYEMADNDSDSDRAPISR